MPNNTLATVDPVGDKGPSKQESSVRIEESVEDFLKLHLPAPMSLEKLEIKQLWSNNAGNRYFRCNYWKKDGDCYGNVPRSFFVRVEKGIKGNTFVNLTLTK